MCIYLYRQKVASKHIQSFVHDLVSKGFNEQEADAILGTYKDRMMSDCDELCGQEIIKEGCNPVTCRRWDKLDMSEEVADRIISFTKRVMYFPSSQTEGIWEVDMEIDEKSYLYRSNSKEMYRGSFQFGAWWFEVTGSHVKISSQNWMRITEFWWSQKVEHEKDDIDDMSSVVRRVVEHINGMTQCDKEDIMVNPMGYIQDEKDDSVVYVPCQSMDKWLHKEQIKVKVHTIRVSMRENLHKMSSFPVWIKDKPVKCWAFKCSEDGIYPVAKVKEVKEKEKTQTKLGE
jgi:hypothetical protein